MELRSTNPDDNWLERHTLRDDPTLVEEIDKTLARACQRADEHPGISIGEDTLHCLLLLVPHDEFA